MKRLRSWAAMLRDPEVSAQERMYRFLVVIGLSTLFFVMLVGVFVEEDKIGTVTLFAGFLMLSVVYQLTLRFHKLGVGMRILVLVMVLFVVPVSFFAGGIYGGGPVWFVFNFLLIAILLSGRERLCFWALEAVITVACYTITYYHPEKVAEHDKEIAYMDSLTSVFLLGGLICSLIVFQQYTYHQKSRRSEEQRKEIVELNRAQNRFFSSMSHEIRTPINTIIGLNEMNLRENLSTEVAENSLHIQSASRILLSLINDILDMSRIESGKMTIVPVTYDVGEMLSEVVGMIWGSAKDKGLAFSVEVDKTMPRRLIGDEVRIKQVLINVLTNSVKYTQKGSVALSIRCVHKENGKAIIAYAIDDTGVGIKKENIPYLFNAFRREDEDKNRYIEGTGLGLAIVKQLVDLMEGDIKVDSIYTKGSTFVVTLPQQIVDDEELGEFDRNNHQAVDQRKVYKQSFEAPQARVLLVDDNEVNILVARKLLRETKVQVDSVTSGAEALAKTLEIHYDIIFMDHLMPQMDGIECLHEIRRQSGGVNTDTPIIVLTANAGSDLLAMYKREGFDDCILKPVTGELLEEGLLAYLPPELVTAAEDVPLSVDADVPILTHNRKRPIMITTESVCDLPERLLASKQIAVIPFSIYTEEGDFLDGKEIEAEGVLSYLTREGKHAENREPDVAAYEAFFSENLQRASVVLHITASKKVSGAFAKAMEAARAFDNVTVIDSGLLSSGMGLVVLRAAQMIEDGAYIDSIRREISSMQESVRMAFVVNSIRYLAQSGRVPHRAVAMTEAFMLRPVVAVQDGIMRPERMMFGDRRQVWKQFIRNMLREKERIDTGTLFIAYSGLQQATLKSIAQEVQQYVRFEHVIFQKVSAASASMFGPGTFGLAYLKKKDGMEISVDVSMPVERREHVLPSVSNRNYDRSLPEDGTNDRPVEPESDLQEYKDEEVPAWLYEIEGLDVAQGISYCATADGYMAALDIFYSTIEQKADEIAGFYADEDVENYTIKVHALKSSARIIGAAALSELALSLEMAGKENDTETIRRDTERLLADYRSYKDKLSALREDAADAEDKEDISPEILADAYQSIKEFAEQMDFNLVEMVLQSIKEYRLPAADAKRMKDIEAAANVLDWDRIRDILTEE